MLTVVLKRDIKFVMFHQNDLKAEIDMHKLLITFLNCQNMVWIIIHRTFNIASRKFYHVSNFETEITAGHIRLFCL